MGIGGGIEAGKAFVKFLLEDKAFKSGLRSAGKSLQTWGAIGTAATAPVVAGLTACVAAAVQVGGQLADMSARTGISVDALSELKFAADQTGASMGTVEKAVRKSQVQIAAAAAGTGRFGATLQSLGLNINEIKNLSPEDQFTALATAVGRIQDPTQRAALATKVFGRSGAELIPMLADAAGGVAGLRAKARELGVTLTAEDAAACDALGDALDGAKKQFTAMAVRIGVAVAGPLTEFLTWSQRVLKRVIVWIKENPRLVAGIAAVTTAIAACSAAAVAFGTILAVISAHPIVAALTAIAAILVGIATYFGLASSGAKDFKRELDKIKAPGAKVDPATQREADAIAARLQAATQQASVPAAPAAATADSATKQAGEGMQEVARWTRDTAEGVRRLVQLVSSSEGLLVGSG